MKKPQLLQAFSGLLILVLPLLMYSCYPGGPQETQDLDIVGTIHDQEFNFAGAVTYTMPDTIIHIIGEDEDPADIDRSYDDLILSTIKTNMDVMGYQWMDLDTLNPADVVLLVSAVFTTNSGISYSSGWFGGYWGYYPGFGGSYPGYGYGFPSYPVYYSYSTGSIFINMVNPKDFNPDEETIGLVWMATLNGILKGEKDKAQTRLTEGIEQAFKQSEYYLKKN